MKTTTVTKKELKKLAKQSIDAWILDEIDSEELDNQLKFYAADFIVQEQRGGNMKRFYSKELNFIYKFF